MSFTADELIGLLSRPGAYDHPVDDVSFTQTHVSIVVLAGDYAYKIRKPLKLDVVKIDYTTIEKRQACSHGEVSFNSAASPGLYCGVVPIVRLASGELKVLSENDEAPETEEVVEYAIKMNRFNSDHLLLVMLENETLALEHIEQVVDKILILHQVMSEQVIEDSSLGSYSLVRYMLESGLGMMNGLVEGDVLESLNQFGEVFRDKLSLLEPLFNTRHQQGYVKSRHGDCHLENMALLNGELVIFDGMEDSMRWLDAACDPGFLFMDLSVRGNPSLAYHMVNCYFDKSGDFGAAPLIHYFSIYYAMVRALVALLQDLEPEEKLIRYNRYMMFATQMVEQPYESVSDDVSEEQAARQLFFYSESAEESDPPSAAEDTKRPG